MKISASLYSANQQDLPSLVHELEALNLDFFHIDCFDGEEAKVGKDIKAIQSFSDIPIDLHAISNFSQKYCDLATKWNVTQLTLQFENLKEDLNIPKIRNYKFGLALVNETDLEVLKPFEKQIDYILLMTTTPGKSGGKFQKDSFDRIRKCKAMYPKLPIYVDGGINAEISFILRLLGVSLAVSGSFLVNNNNIALALSDLRFHQKGSNFLLKDFMQNREDLPILNKQKCSFNEIVTTMESYNYGFVMFEENGKLMGITSNADLRRGILKNLDDLQNIKVDDVINTSPICIQENASTYEMISLIKKYDFPILFLPIIDEQNNLKGTITFNELIKGEG